MVYNYKFSGFTLLSLANIVNINGNATGEMAPFKNALVKKPAKVAFTVQNANASSNQSVYITGSAWELANWTTGFYPLALTNSNGVWSGSYYIREGCSYEFKAIKKNSSGNVTWESGSNKFYTVPSGGGSYTLNWAN